MQIRSGESQFRPFDPTSERFRLDSRREPIKFSRSPAAIAPHLSLPGYRATFSIGYLSRRFGRRYRFVLIVARDSRNSSTWPRLQGTPPLHNPTSLSLFFLPSAPFSLSRRLSERLFKFATYSRRFSPFTPSARPSRNYPPDESFVSEIDALRNTCIYHNF